MALSVEIIETLASSSRPLIVCDIDEVVLEFIDPFGAFLESVEHRLHPDSFRLHGNIRAIADGKVASGEQVSAFIENFFASQDRWQKPAAGAATVLANLCQEADIVFLTAMPPKYHGLRRALLDAAGLHYPMISTEEPKGPVVAALIGNRRVPTVFIDDIAHNHHSVREHAPECLLLHLMANGVYRSLAPRLDDDIVSACDWQAAEQLVRDHIARHAATNGR